MKNSLAFNMRGLGLITALSMLTGCVSNPADIGNTLNVLGQVANTTQQVRGNGMAGAGMNALANGAVTGNTLGGNNVIGNAENAPIYARAENALTQLNLSKASCKQIQSKQQATLNAMSEIESLTDNLMFNQQHERLQTQSNSIKNIAQSKKCRLPTIATATGVNTPKKFNHYTSLSCSKLAEEWSAVNQNLTVTNTTESTHQQIQQGQGAITAIAQAGALFGASRGLGNAQQLNQMAQVAQVAGTVAGATNGNVPAGVAVPTETNLILLERRTSIEAAANSKRCKLPAIASATGMVAPTSISYANLNCSKLAAEWNTVKQDLETANAAESASQKTQQGQVAISAIAQMGALFGGNMGLGNAQQLNQVAQVAGAVTGAANAAAPGTAAPVESSLGLQERKASIENTANIKRCKLPS